MKETLILLFVCYYVLCLILIEYHSIVFSTVLLGYYDSNLLFLYQFLILFYTYKKYDYNKIKIYAIFILKNCSIIIS